MMNNLVYNERTGEFEEVGTKLPHSYHNGHRSVQSAIHSDNSYYYIEGVTSPYKWEQIKTMQLLKGTRVRKMLDDVWFPIEHFGLMGVPPVEKSQRISSISNPVNNKDNSSVPSPNPNELSYFYVEGDTYPHKFYEIKNMRLPKGTRIRKMLDNMWYPIEHFGIMGIPPVKKPLIRSSIPKQTNNRSNSSFLRMSYNDYSYFYIEGESHPYKWSEIKNMRLPKGTRIRKMLDDNWIVVD